MESSNYRKMLKEKATHLLSQILISSYQVAFLTIATFAVVLLEELSLRNISSLATFIPLVVLASIKLSVLVVFIHFQSRKGWGAPERKVCLQNISHICTSINSCLTIGIHWLGNKRSAPGSSQLVLFEISMIEQVIAQQFTFAQIPFRLISILAFFSLETSMDFFIYIEEFDDLAELSLAFQLFLPFLLLQPSKTLLIEAQKEGSKDIDSSGFGSSGVDSQSPQSSVDGHHLIGRKPSKKSSFRPRVGQTISILKKKLKYYDKEDEVKSLNLGVNGLDGQNKERNLTQRISKPLSSKIREINSKNPSIAPINKKSASINHFLSKSRASIDLIETRKGERPSSLALSVSNQSGLIIDNDTYNVEWLPLPSFVICLEKKRIESANLGFKEKFDIQEAQGTSLSEIEAVLGIMKTHSYQGAQNVTFEEIIEKVWSGELDLNSFPLLFRSKLDSKGICESHELEIWLKLFVDKGAFFILAQVLDSSDGTAAIEMRDEVMNSFSHELRTPLNIIKATLSLLVKSKGKSEVESPEFFENYLKPAFESAKLIIALISSITDHSAILMGTYEKRPSKKSISRFLEKTLKFFQTKAKEKQVQLRKILSANSPKTWETDFHLVQQILIEILSNSLKFSKPNGSVSIESRINSAGKLCFKVVDTGIGMSKKELKRLQNYLKFDCSRRKISKNSSGIGIGMAIVRGALIRLNKRGQGLKIVSNESGTSFEFALDEMPQAKSSKDALSSFEASFNVLVSGQSSSSSQSLQIPSQDSVIFEEKKQNFSEISIPQEKSYKTTRNISPPLSPPKFNPNLIKEDHLLISEESSAFSQKEPSVMSPETVDECQCQNVLVVDDEKANRMVLIANLKKVACVSLEQIIEAANGQEAIETIRKMRKCGKRGCSIFRVVFVDMNMPLMDGAEFCRQIKRFFSENSIESHSIFLYTSFNYEEKYKAAGFDGFLPKPFQTKNLKSLLERVKFPLK